MGSSTSGVFTGASRYSSDFSQVITRAVSIASLPLKQLANEKTDLASQSSALAKLEASFLSLQSAVNGIEKALGTASLSTTVSDTSKAKATAGAGALEGKYTIDIISTGAYATAMTKKWDATIPGTHSYKLYIGGDSYALTPADNSAAAVAAAINTKYGDKVRATVAIVDPNTNDYRISLESTTLTAALLDIRDSIDGGPEQSLLDPVTPVQAAGAPAQYKVNGSDVTASSTSRSVKISDGLTVDLLAATAAGSPVSIQVSRSTYALNSALSAFASAYNATASLVNEQRGENAGALMGNSVLWQLTGVLRTVSTYNPGDSALPDMKTFGLELAKDGTLSFNSSTFEQVFAKNPAGIVSFLGGSTTGGFLKSATTSLDNLLNASTGTLTSVEKSLTSQINRLSRRIEQEQARVDKVEERLLAQMAAADALIASMEQKYDYIFGMFGAMETANKQYA